MRNWFYIVLGYAVLILALFLVARHSDDMTDKWKVAEANVKAYDELLSMEREKSVAYSLTIDQLGGARDSLIQELDGLRTELGVKDKDLKALQNIRTVVSKADTVVFNDTLFIDSLSIDTVVGDEWCSVRVGLSYPSSVSVIPEFKSEKGIVVSVRKETVNPRKKWWLLRLFQKKHKVLHVDVVEKNPYVTGSESRYVEILK